MGKLILIGAGGHCTSVIDSISNKFKVVGILDNKRNKEQVLGVNIIGTDDDLKLVYDSGVTQAFICFVGIMKGKERRKIYNNLKDIGFSFPNIIDSTAIVSKNATLDEGIFIGKGAIINAGAHIGSFSVVNTGAIVEHDCDLGEFVHLAPGAVICGGTKVLENSHIGINATVLQGLNIGKNVLVAAGSVIIGDLQDNIMVCGNPGRKMKNE